MQRLPRGLESLMLALAQRRNEVRLTAAVGSETRQEIARAISDVGMPTLAPWVWAVTERRPIGGGVIVGRLVVPLHIIGRDGLFPFDFATEYDWKEAYQGYRFELFGRRIDSPDEAAQCPSGWQMTLESDPDLDGPGYLHVAVWRARVTHAETPLFGRADWRPGWPAVAYAYGGVVPGETNDTRIADRGLRLLRNIPFSRGKQPGDGAAWESDQSFLADLDAAAAKVCRGSGHKIPDARAVMRELSLGKTAFYERVKKATGKRWRDVARGYASGLNYAELNGTGRPQNGE